MATLYYRPATAELIRDPTLLREERHGTPPRTSASDSQLLKTTKDEGLPSHDALESLLPQYKYIMKDKDKPEPLHPNENDKEPKARPEDVERVSMSLLDYQQQELEKYREAVHTMGADILTLRQQVRELEVANSQLRSDLAHYEDSTRLLRDAQELDGLSKADLADRYVSLKHNLTRQSGELRDYKDKVLKLQNELIKMNDKEKDHKRLSEAHTDQQDVLQRLQERANKVRRLEDVIRKQEKVIEKMEKIINSRSRGHSKEAPAADDSVNDALLAENHRLRAELEQATEAVQRSSREMENHDQERLGLYSRLERAEGRIVSLEKQLSENARQWARERSDLVLKLKESEHGLARTPPLSNPRTPPGLYTVPKPKPRFKEEPKGESRRFSHYNRQPTPGRRNKPHIGYNPALYDPLQHS